jgi:predicted acetyltransferase
MPCAGVTVVGVYRTHRRRGALTAMMRVQLDDIRERGEPIAALWASEERIYGRFGYRMASLAGEIKLSRDHASFAVPHEPDGRVRIVEPEEAKELLPPVWDAVRPRTPGMFARTATWWEHRIFRDPEDRRQGAGPKRFVVHEADGGVDGFAFYRHAPEWEAGVSKTKLRVLEAIGATPQATRDLWRYLLDVDWTETIEAYLLPIDHRSSSCSASRAGCATAPATRSGYASWTWARRCRDAPTPQAARSSSTCATTSARGTRAGGGWKAARRGRPTTRPTIRLDVTALGSVFLGGFTFAELHRACRLEEARGGSVARADAIFRTDVAPWCPEIF